MIVDCAIYRNGKRLSGHDSPHDAQAVCGAQEDAFVWIGLYEPTEEEFETVRSAFDLHELAVEDAIKAHQRPKLEVYDGTLFLVLKPAQYVDEREEVEFGEILLFVGPRFVVSVRHRATSSLGDVRRRLEADDEMLRHGPAAALYAVVELPVHARAGVAVRLPARGRRHAAALRRPLDLLPPRRLALSIEG